MLNLYKGSPQVRSIASAAILISVILSKPYQFLASIP